MPNKQEIQIPSENISLTGIMIAASQQEFETILHRKTPEGNNIQPELHASFIMPRKGTKNLTVNAQCRAVHVRRVSQDKYFIGLKFLQLNQSAASAIQRHIENNIS